MAALKQSIRLGFEEIQAFVLVCKSCDSEFSIPTGDYRGCTPSLPAVCPNPDCEKEFFTNAEYRNQSSREQNMIECLWNLVKKQENRCAFLRVEIDGSTFNG